MRPDKQRKRINEKFLNPISSPLTARRIGAVASLATDLMADDRVTL